MITHQSKSTITDDPTLKHTSFTADLPHADTPARIYSFPICNKLGRIDYQRQSLAPFIFIYEKKRISDKIPYPPLSGDSSQDYLQEPLTHHPFYPAPYRSETYHAYYFLLYLIDNLDGYTPTPITNPILTDIPGYFITCFQRPLTPCLRFYLIGYLESSR